MKDLRIPDMEMPVRHGIKQAKRAKKARKRPFKAKWVRLPTRWITALRRTRRASATQLAHTILLEAFKVEFGGGEIILSAHTTGMPSATRSKAARELVRLGLIKLKGVRRGTLRVVWVAS